MAASAGAADASAWPRDELLRLIEAWGEVVEPPRDREKLSAPELLRLHSRFEALCGRRGGRWLGSMERQRLRLVATFKRIRAFDRGNGKPGQLTWLQLSNQQREDLLAIDGNSVMATIDEDTFRAVERVCREEPPSIDVTATSNINTDTTDTDIGGIVGSEAEVSTWTLDRPSTISNITPTAASGFVVGGNSDDPGSDTESNSRRDQGNNGERPADRAGEERRENEIKAAAEALAGLPIVRVSTNNPSPPSTPASRRGSTRGTDAFYGSSPPLRWRLRDELQLIRAWDDALRRLVEANEPCPTLNALVLERYTEICGPNEESASSIGAKRHKILGAFEFLREYLQARPNDAPQWFEMAVSERLAEQKANGYHQGFACTLESTEFGHLSSIVENQRRLDQINRAASRPTAGDSERSRNDPSQPPTLQFDRDPDPVDNGRDREPRVHRLARGHRDHLPSRYRSATDIADSAVLVSLRHASKRRRTIHSFVQQRGGEEAKHEDDDLSKEGQAEHTPSNSLEAPPLNLVDQLVQAQSRRLELLLEEFREERRQERQQTQELLLLLLSRVDAVPRGDVAALEALVEQQRQHLGQLFELVEAEREAEWGRTQELLSELEDDRQGHR